MRHKTFLIFYFANTYACRLLFHLARYIKQNLTKTIANFKTAIAKQIYKQQRYKATLLAQFSHSVYYCK